MAGTLGDLKARIADDLFRSDMTNQIAGRIPEAIDYYSDDRFWFNERTVAGVTVPGNQYVPLPAGLEILDSVLINAGGSNMYPLAYRSRETLERWYGTTTFSGQPTDFAFDDASGQVRLWGNPNAVYPLSFVGIFDEPALVADIDSNNWTTDLNARALIAARVCMLISRDVLKDPIAAAAFQVAEGDASKSLTRKSVLRATSGGVRPSFGNPS